MKLQSLHHLFFDVDCCTKFEKKEAQKKEVDMLS
jgi:hypothetical protein